MDTNQQNRFDELDARRKVLEAKLQPLANELRQVCRELRSLKSSEAARLKRLQDKQILDKRILDFLRVYRDDYRSKRPNGLIARAAGEFGVSLARVRELHKSLLSAKE